MGQWHIPYAWIGIAFGCTSGAGRPPAFPDAEGHADAEHEDAKMLADAGVRDTGVRDADFARADSGRPIEYPFTGVFGVLDTSNKLYAREFAGNLGLIFGQAPYVYTGTIDSTGVVNVASPLLERSGCAEAVITGRYERATAVFFLHNVTCDAQGGRVEADLRGGFEADFEPAVSGIYELEARVVADVQGCRLGDRGPWTVRYGIEVSPGGNGFAVYTASDIAPATWYTGSIDTSDFGFAAIEQAFATPGPSDASMQGQILLRPLPDPPRLVGQRDVYDPNRACYYTLSLAGARTIAP